MICCSYGEVALNILKISVGFIRDDILFIVLYSDEIFVINFM